VAVKVEADIGVLFEESPEGIRPFHIVAGMNCFEEGEVVSEDNVVLLGDLFQDADEVGFDLFGEKPFGEEEGSRDGGPCRHPRCDPAKHWDSGRCPVVFS